MKFTFTTLKMYYEYIDDILVPFEDIGMKRLDSSSNGIVMSIEITFDEEDIDSLNECFRKCKYITEEIKNCMSELDSGLRPRFYLNVSRGEFEFNVTMNTYRIMVNTLSELGIVFTDKESGSKRIDMKKFDSFFGMDSFNTTKKLYLKHGDIEDFNEIIDNGADEVVVTEIPEELEDLIDSLFDVSKLNRATMIAPSTNIFNDIDL